MEGPSTRLLVLRHGEVAPQHKNYLYGQMDVELSEVGEEQARRTGQHCRQYPVRAVYSSDLQRALTLGREIGRHHGIVPVRDERLRERHFGHWQGLPWSEIAERFPEEQERYYADRFTTRVPGGAENFLDVQSRVRPFLREVLARHPGECIAITAHSGTVRIILAECMSIPLECIFTFEQDYCCLNVIDYWPTGRMRVNVLNYTDHVAELL